MSNRVESVSPEHMKDRLDLDNACLKYAAGHRAKSPDDEFGYALLKALRVPVFQQKGLMSDPSLRAMVYETRLLMQDFLRLTDVTLPEQSYFCVSFTGRHQLRPLLRVVDFIQKTFQLVPVWLVNRSFLDLVPESHPHVICLEEAAFSRVEDERLHTERKRDAMRLIWRMYRSMSIEPDAVKTFRQAKLSVQLDGLGQYILSRDELPSLFLCANPRTFENALFMQRLRDRGAAFPLVAIQHGHLVPGDPTWRELAVDQFWTFGEAGRQIMLDAGYEAARVKAVGRIDRITTDDSIPAPHLQGRRLSLLVAFSGPGHSVSYEQHVEVIRILEQAIASTNHSWIIRLHPKDDAQHYRACLEYKHVTLDVFSKERQSFSDAILEADVVVTVTSNSANEAMVAGRPVICILPEAIETPDAVYMGAALEVRTPEDFDDALERLPVLDATYFAAQKKYLEYTLGGDGFEEALQRIIEKEIPSVSQK